MAETTAEVRRDIELTRERMSDTLAQLEQKLNVMQIVRDHPWPSLAVAAGAGLLLSGSRADVKAAAAAVKATEGASSRIGTVLDDVAATLISGVSGAFASRIDSLVGELKNALGAPPSDGRHAAMAGRASGALGSPNAGADRQMLGASEGGQRGNTQTLGFDPSSQDSGGSRSIGARAD